MDDAPQSAPRSLERFAWRISGPRDFVVNLAFNTAIPWYVLAGAETTPVAGPQSVSHFLAPMMMSVSAFTTFFAYFSGVRERRLGRALPPLEPDARWLPSAIRSGLCYGALGLTVGLCLAVLLSWLAPTATLPRVAASLALGIGSGGWRAC